MLALAPSYDLRTALAVPRMVRALARAVVVLLAAYLVVYFYAPRYELPRLVAVYVLWEGALLTLGWRLVYIWFVTHLPLDKHLLILGASEAGRPMLGLLREAGQHAPVVGLADDDRALWGGAVSGRKGEARGSVAYCLPVCSSCRPPARPRWPTPTR